MAKFMTETGLKEVVGDRVLWPLPHRSEMEMTKKKIPKKMPAPKNNGQNIFGL